MEFQIKDNYYVVRLDKGEKVIEKLQEFFEFHQIKSGHFTAIGALDEVTLRYLDQPKKDMIDKNFNEEFEVTSLNGNVTQMENKPYIHAHVVLGRRDYSVLSGHFVEGRIGATLEVNGFISKTIIGRKLDEVTGLNLIDCSLN